jgi:CDP-glycerol glycerophosphotransferase
VPVADLVRETDVGDDVARAEHESDGVAWNLYLGAGDRRSRLSLHEMTPEWTWPFKGREIVLHRTRFGNLSLLDRSFRPVFTDVSWSAAGALLLTGSFRSQVGEHELIVASRRGPERHAVPLAYDNMTGRFAVEFTPAAVMSLGGTRPLPVGQWEFRVRRRDATQGTVNAVVAHDLLAQLPISVTVGHQQFKFGVLGYQSPILQVEPDLDNDERGAFRQHQLRTSLYLAQRERGLRDAVVYHCFEGREYSDSPRAVHEELVRRGAPVEHLWVVRNGACQVPESAVPVREGSREYYAAFARARYLVTNDYWPRWFDRRPDQTSLVTWHGTPLKRHGYELADRPRAVRAFRSVLSQRTENWQYVVSPGGVSTSILRRAFPVGAELIETGLPRTDLFLRPYRDRLAEDVRRRLGLPTGKRVVLYAPTYRDQLAVRDGYRLGPLLNLAALGAALGDDHSLLFRKHRLSVGTLPADADGCVLDVSEYPDANELLLAADTLVTDYSSLTFDFATTRRPIIFFTPDLEEYRDEIRGFSLDFEAEAPGPLLRTTEEVIDALRGADTLHEEYRERYETFLERYCPLSDGHASSRVVERVFRW